MDMADTAARVERLWDVCQVPDYRKIAPANHGDMLLALYTFLIRDGAIPDDWIARQVRYADRTDGDIDTLSNRIAHIRTWTFVANRNDWLADPAEWRETTRQVEDRLSDALHQRLMQRFVDRRTSVLMKRLRENRMLESEVNDAGDVIVEGQHLGVLHGFRFQTDASTGDPRDQKALRAAASKALIPEMERRADKAAAAPDTAFSLGSDAGLRWQGALIGKVVATDDTLKPAAVLLADDTLSAAARDKVQGRLGQWLAAHIEGLLKPLFDLRNADALEGGARGLAYRISEGLGSVERGAVAEEAKALDQAARAGLRSLGVRFGAYHIFVPALLKPAPSQLLALLWALKEADLDVTGLQEVPQLSASGRTSIPVDPEIPPALYGVVGFRVCGPRAVRIDILERLADQIRPLVAWRPGPDSGEPPAGAVPSGGAFLVTVTMTSLLGCSGDDFAAVLSSLGYRVERREANPAEREAVEAAQQVRRAAPKKSGKPGRPPIPVRSRAATAASDAPAEADAQPEASEAAEADETTAEPMTDEPQTEAPAEAAPADLAETPAAADAEEAPVETSAEAAAEPSEPEVSSAPTESPLDAAAEENEPDAGEQPSADVAADYHGAETAEAEPAEAVAAEAEAEPDAEAEAAAPLMIEIWRVPRHQRSEGPRRRRGAPAEGEEGGESRRRPRRGGQRGGPRTDAVPGQPGGAPRTGGEAPAPGGQPEARGDRPDQGDRGPRRGKKRGKGAPPPRETVQPQRPPRREREADPDSPFAKLAALKQQLEKGPGDR